MTAEKRTVMSGRARCLAALRGDNVDRIPNYTPTVASDVASALLEREALTGSPTLWYEIARAHCRGGAAFAELSAQIDEDLIALGRRMKMDVIRYGYRMEEKPARQLDEYTFLYGDAAGLYDIWRYDPGAMNFSRIETSRPSREPECWPQLAREAARNLPAALEAVRARSGVWEEAMQRRVGDTMLVAGAGGGFSIGLDEGAMMAALLEPEAVGDLLDCQLEIAIAGAEAAAARGVRVLLGGGDMADNHGTLFSPEVFAGLLLPRVRKFARRAAELGIHYVFRSDGNMWGVCDMLFGDAGVPGYGEVDFLASMEAGRLRQRYPELVIWANVAGATMRRGTPEMVYEQSLATLRGAGPTRHFFGNSNTILPGTPLANVEAMMRAAADYAAEMAHTVNHAD